MATSVTWNGTTYSIPASGELNWQALNAFLINLGTNAAITGQGKQAIRVATTTPVTVAAATDFAVISDLGTAGAVAVALPAGATGQIFAIMDGKGDASTNNITITPNGAETIGGAATLVLNHANQMVLIQFVSGNWHVLINCLKPGTILDADIIAAAGIARSKIAGGTAYRVLANTSTGAMGENAALTAAHVLIADANGQLAGEATLAKTRGGCAADMTNVTFPATGTLATLAGTETLSGKSVATDLKFANEAIAKFYEASGTGTNFIGIKAPAAVTADKTFILPDGDGSAGQVLKTDGSLALGWASAVTDPTDARGQLIRRGASVLEKVTASTDNRVVRGDGTDVILGQIDDPAFFTTGAAAGAGTVGCVNNDSGNTAGTPIRGSTDGSDAAAGYVGQFYSGVGSGVTVGTSTTYTGVASTGTLTPGQYIVSGSVGYDGTATGMDAVFVVADEDNTTLGSKIFYLRNVTGSAMVSFPMQIMTITAATTNKTLSVSARAITNGAGFYGFVSALRIR